MISLSSEKINNTIRIVQLSDIHNSEFGEANARIVEKIQAQRPDIVLITGDIINSDEYVTKIAVNLISSLCKVAPVYISIGNHENDFEQKYGVDIAQIYENAGAIVLDKEYIDISVNNQQIRLGGIYGYCLPEKYGIETIPEECNYLNEFQMTDVYSVLMCHMPVCWIENDGLDEWDIDLVLAGHAHGGQIRVPILGGLWAPDQGWFPGKESGLYYSADENKVLVLSRGLGSNEVLPRFNNTPEIVVLDLIHE